MIHIEKDQSIKTDSNLKVASNTGDYEDNALIEFYDVNTPNVIAGSFAAQFIKYGDMVYKFNDPKELGAEILKIDPTSTHVAASFVRMNNELLAQMNNGSLESDSLDQVIATEKENTEIQRSETTEEVSDGVLVEDSSEEQNIPVVEDPVVSTSSTTPSTQESEGITDIIDSVIEEPVIVETTTTTPEAIPEVIENIADVATSTEQ